MIVRDKGGPAGRSVLVSTAPAYSTDFPRDALRSCLWDPRRVPGKRGSGPEGVPSVKGVSEIRGGWEIVGRFA